MCNINDNVKSVQTYLNWLLDDAVTIKQAGTDIISSLPQGVISCFNLYKLRILEKEVLLAVPIDEEIVSPLQIRKQQELIERTTGIVTVFAFCYLASYNVQRMVAQRVNFILPGKQMFIPSLLLDMRPLRGGTRKSKDSVPAMAQCIVLYHLQIAPLNGMTALSIANILGGSYPNIIRAIRWLADKGFVLFEGLKTKTIWFILAGRELWNAIEPMLVNPVERVVYTDAPFEGGFVSGINALSEYSMINSDKESIFAIGKDYYRLEQKRTNKEFGSTRLEVWKYKPSLLTKNSIVDKLSLYLSLRENEDERIQIELENMINEMLW